MAKTTYASMKMKVQTNPKEIAQKIGLVRPLH